MIKKNRHGLFPIIWKTHCIEDSDGHKIYKDLQSALDKHQNVRYHLKGQNELTEMYSIFSAENQEVPSNLKSYSGKKLKCDDPKMSEKYESIINCLNTNINTNIDLIKKIVIGSKNITKNIYICGQARTHCVRSSIIDMIDNVKATNVNNYHIKFIKNMSSAIPGFDKIKNADGTNNLMYTDNIDAFIVKVGGQVYEWNSTNKNVEQINNINIQNYKNIIPGSLY